MSQNTIDNSLSKQEDEKRTISTPKTPMTPQKFCLKKNSFKMNLPPREMKSLTTVSLTPCSSGTQSNSQSPSIRSEQTPSATVTPSILIPSNLPANPKILDDEKLQESSNSQTNVILDENNLSKSSCLSSGKFERKFGASKIIDNIFIGGVIDSGVTEHEVLKEHNIQRVLNVAYECDNTEFDSIVYKKVDLKDSIEGAKLMNEKLMECIEFIEEGIIMNQKVLVHCFAGLSRSVSVVIGYLMKTKAEELKRRKEHNENINSKEYQLFYNALDLVQKKRSEDAGTNNWGFSKILHQYEKKLLDEIGVVQKKIDVTINNFEEKEEEEEEEKDKIDVEEK